MELVTSPGGAPRRGDVWWVELGPPRGSGPAGRRPAVVVSADRFNRSAISTVVIAAVTSNIRLAQAPGNVALPAGTAELDRDSVVNVAQLAAVDTRFLAARSGSLTEEQVSSLDRGLRLALDL